jgi:Na+/proline symporter
LILIHLIYASQFDVQIFWVKNFSYFDSYVSGISLLGLPAEMYTFGTQYWMIVLSELVVSVTMAYAIIPVFYELNITSSYEVGKIQNK